MQLDKDLVREILLAIEANEQPPLGWMTLRLANHSPEFVSYQVMQLHDAGFIAGEKLGGLNHFEWQPKHLTYKGHEFLDTVRDEEIWRRTKAGAEKAGGAGLGLLLEIGKAYGKQMFKEKLGIELP